MNQDHLILVAKDLNIAVTQVAAAAKLLEEGATVPFIARYRKEATGTLDEVQIAKIRDDLERLKAIDDRRDAIKKSLSERNLLSADLEKSLDAADSLARLEDIYQPFKPKRRTRATAAWRLLQILFSTTRKPISPKRRWNLCRLKKELQTRTRP